MQAELSSQHSKVGIDMISVGTSQHGGRAVRITVAFFIFVITFLIETPHLEKLVRTLRKSTQRVLEHLMTRQRHQLVEGRTGHTDNEELLVDLQRHTKRVFSRHLAQLLHRFWIVTQARDQFKAHKLGAMLKFRWLNLFSAVASRIQHPVLSIDSTFESVSQGSITVWRPPYVLKVEPQLIAFDGTTTLYVTGLRFGSQPMELLGVFIGDRKCTHINWFSSTELQCRAPVFDHRELGFSDNDNSGIGLCLLYAQDFEFFRLFGFGYHCSN